MAIHAIPENRSAADGAKLAQLGLTLGLLVLALLLPVFALLNLPAVFYYEFSRYGVYQNLPAYSQTELQQQFGSILSYMQGNASLDSAFFSVADLVHMQDVQSLTRQSGFVCLAALLVCLVALLKQGRWQNLQKSSALAAIIILALAASGLLWFDRLFILFHQLSFSNNFWMLNPTTSNLIRFLPQDLFADLAAIILLAALAGLFTLNRFAIIMQLWRKKQK